MKRLDYNAAKNTTQNIKYKQNILKAEKKEAHSQSEHTNASQKNKKSLVCLKLPADSKKKKNPT